MSPRLRGLTVALLALTALVPAAAGAVPINGFQPMRTGQGCNPNVGAVSVGVDAYGAFGSATANHQDALYDPIDQPDRGPRGTVYESMPFLCKSQAGVATGNWMEQGRVADIAPARADGNGNSLTSDFVVDGLAAHLEASLDCNILTECWSFTNRSGARLDQVELTPYIDGDLYFRGNYTNDYGGVSVGNPRTLYEFDEGDDPHLPTTYLALFSQDPADPHLSNWEIGQYSESRARIGRTNHGCEALRGDITDSMGVPTDANGDYVTDTNYDVTLSLRYSLGPLEDGEMSPVLCYDIQWGVGLQCSDEDQDQVCVIDDNCPSVANPNQDDFDRDGVGDVCDNCPHDANPGQENADGDLQGDACDNCIQPVPELCNGLDDDCDNTTDEDTDGQPCDTGLLGVCAIGHQVCGGAAGLSCQPDTPAAAEICDGLDNDCNGTVDDAVPEDGTACVTGNPGACSDGVTRCLEGALSCVALSEPSEEICDTVDNNCDGRVDEGTRNACGLCGDVPIETCNGLDDNCDGQIDNDAPCDPGSTCSHGRCAPLCVNNECGDLSYCSEGVCLTACEIQPCAAGLTCDVSTGQCSDPCAGVSCGPNDRCVDGVCVTDDCYGTGCPDGLLCVGAICVPNPCAGVTCDAGQFCRGGVCVLSCADVSCAGSEQCQDGICAPNDCAGVTCPDGQLCAAGACGDDPCQGVTCDGGRRCEGGACVDDPCNGVACAPGETCFVEAGSAQCGRTEVIEADAGPAADAGTAADGGLGDGGPDFAVIVADGTVPITTLPDANHTIESVPPASSSGCGCRQAGPDGGRAILLLLLPLMGASSVRRARRPGPAPGSPSTRD